MSSVHFTVLFPGIFDLLTKGHEALIKRSADLFSNVIVAIAANPRTAPVLSRTCRFSEPPFKTFE